VSEIFLRGTRMRFAELRDTDELSPTQTLSRPSTLPPTIMKST
jgi:hypothetical protein